MEIRLTENITIKVTSYIEYPVDLSDYTMPTCIECDPQAPECPSELPLMPDLFDFKRHRQQAGTVDGELVDTYMLHGSEATPKPYYAKGYFDDDELVSSNPYNTTGATRRNLRSARGRKLSFVKKAFGKKKRKKEKKKKQEREKRKQMLDRATQDIEPYFFDTSVFISPPSSPPPPPPSPPPPSEVLERALELDRQRGDNTCVSRGDNDCWYDLEEDWYGGEGENLFSNDYEITLPSTDVGKLGTAFPRPPPRCQSWSTTKRLGVYGPTQCPLDKPEVTEEYLTHLRETDRTKFYDLLATFDPPFENNELFDMDASMDVDLQTVFAALEGYRGRCWGRTGEQLQRYKKNLMLVNLDFIYYQNPVCGLQSVYLRGKAGGGGCPFRGRPFANFKYKSPKLCGVTTCNAKMGGSLGCRWDVMDFVEEKAKFLKPVLEDTLKIVAEVELKLTWEYPGALGVSFDGWVRVGYHKMLPWPLRALRAGLGAELRFEATGTIDFAKRYGQFKAGSSGHVCLGICVPVSLSIASPKFRF